MTAYRFSQSWSTAIAGTGLALSAPPTPSIDKRWALFLDVDGTLLDIAEHPDAVTIPDGLIGLLSSLHEYLKGAMALISGRRIVSLDSLFHPLKLPCAGLHGFELRHSDGNESHAEIDIGALATMRIRSKRLAQTLPEIFVEDKKFSVAFHFRHARLQEPVLRSHIEAIARDSGFVLQRGIDVYELRPPGIDKGSALKTFMGEFDFQQRTPIYIGDDLTDEHALAVVTTFGGMGICVGSHALSSARFALTDPRAVLHWLHCWARQLATSLHH